MNIDASGDLNGFAWGENIGWVNFDTSVAGTDRARFDAAAGRFRGYAWGENVGWINLDDPVHFVGVLLEFIRGDGNFDGLTDLSDAIYVLTYLFLGGPGPRCEDAADVDDSGVLDISDAIYVLGHLFLGTRAPPAPYPDAGEDPTKDALSCRGF